MPRFPARSGLAVIALAAASVFSACGDSDTLSQEDFVAQADRLCRGAQDEFAEVQRTPPSTAEQAERQAAALVEVSNQALDELRTLEPPEELRTAYDRYLAARERAIAALEAGREAAADNDPAAYDAAKRRAARGQAERLRLARSLGLKVCSRPSITLGES